MADVIKGEMLRGQIDTVILLALLEGDKDSNDIRTAIEEKSDNQYSIKQGTFYSAMQRLVKQGYIKEYRSSAMDGIRRKYYSITPKGDEFLDKNREQWAASKTLVDTLFETEEEKVEDNKPLIEETKTDDYVDELDSFKAFVDDNADDFKVTEPENEDDYFDSICADVLTDLNNELELTPQQLPLHDNEDTDIIEDKSSDFEENYEKVSEKSKEELFEFDLFKDNDLVKEVEPDSDKDIEIPTETQSTQTYEDYYQELEQDLAVEEEIEQKFDEDSNSDNVVEEVEEDSEEDDQLVVEEYLPTNKNKYKQILNKILPRENLQADNSPANFYEDKPQEIKVDETVYETKQEQVNDEVPQKSEPNLNDEKVDEKPKKYPTQDYTDFSDLYEMANREGFKIRTSYSTNKFVGNEILINKLRMHSSLVFFLIIALECLILNFALGSILNWKLGVKFIILGCLAIYPLVSLIIYLINSKKSVYEIASFKDAMSVALIITFQLSIIILCVALFVAVDFNNFKEVTTFILLPFILAINIPMYFILKYSLLSTDKYFTKK